MTRKLSAILCTISLIVSFSASSYAADSWSAWESKTTKNPNKEWTVEFSSDLDANSVNSDSIYITNGSDLKIPATISTTSDTINIAPKNSYESGMDYYLYISKDIKSIDGQNLESGFKMPFTYENSGGTVPGGELAMTFEDPKDTYEKDFIDILGGDISINNNTVTLNLALRDLPSKLTFDKEATGDFVSEYSWAAYIVDGNGEYELVTMRCKQPDSAPTEMSIQDATQTDTFEVYEGSILSGSFSTRIIDEASLSVDTSDNVMTLVGKVPGLDASSVSYIKVETRYDSGEDYSFDDIVILEK